MAPLSKPAIALVLALAALTQGHSLQSPLGESATAKHAEQPQAGPSLTRTGRVTDAAGVLTIAQKSALSQKLAMFEQATQHQMVVVTVSSLDGAEIEPFTRALGNRWGIGRKGINDGVVVLLAPTLRKVRIDVAAGLHDRLTDVMCKTIIDEQMIPYFKQGAFDRGIDAGVTALIDRLS